jgi:hypothetical protein
MVTRQSLASTVVCPLTGDRLCKCCGFPLVTWTYRATFVGGRRLNAVDNLKQGSPLTPDIQRLIAECEAAEHFANGQRAAIVERAA